MKPLLVFLFVSLLQANGGVAGLAPTFAKTFTPSAIPIGTQTTLTFTIRNPNPIAIDGLAFTDDLPAGVQFRPPLTVTAVCGAGALISFPNNGGTITLTGGSAPANGTCTITVTVTAIQLGTQVNTTGNVTSTTPGIPAGAVATATLIVYRNDSYSVSYAANLTIGDGLINITNSGARGADLASWNGAPGTGGNVTGAVCANVYAFSPDEQMISCCSCPVTPNALVNLSAQRDLISNTLTPSVPTSIVVKMVGTIPADNTCTNSAAQVAPENLAPGLHAWMSTIHFGGSTSALLPQDQVTAQLVPAPTFRTEIPFSPGTLSVGEINRLRSLCNFIVANGSGYGLCRSCRIGALGGSQQ